MNDKMRLIYTVRGFFTAEEYSTMWPYDCGDCVYGGESCRVERSYTKYNVKRKRAGDIVKMESCGRHSMRYKQKMGIK